MWKPETTIKTGRVRKALRVGINLITENMFVWLIILIGLGALIGLIYGLGKGGNDSAKEGAALGAFTGFGLFMVIVEIAVPILIILAIIKSCS